MIHKYILLFILLFVYSCASTYDERGIYHYKDNIHSIEIEILNNNRINVVVINSGIKSLCNGDYKKASKNRIVFDCKDFRGDSINKGSIVNIIPSELSIYGDIIKLKKNKIIYKGIVLKKIAIP